MEHFKVNNLFNDNQYGFIKGRSTNLQLLSVLDKWTKDLDDGGQIDVIYTDFEKAFDKVPHRRLISKLKSYGINSGIIKWIEAFLLARKQTVRINSSLSEWQSVISGIPQGSVLGPLLFVIYINDMPDLIEKFAQVSLFADDAKISRYVVNKDDSIQLQEALEILHSWSEEWLLKLNISKCKVLSITRGTAQDNAYRLNTLGGTCNLESGKDERLRSYCGREVKVL